ncbi:bis-aminopropyl spermidine synthase family protein [Solirubrobacter ginsenosidimutans]|uniref:Bis-aminopropyl spermidine synthase family protein n=1 Tax=Solirubrobacter ginsenosidimutans TaxID=490573 RepID=A0A9X3MM77_9ACTN|nr:bis-aminopropyl spermidine synthase family protein [Solirubrobacter ginsenosidimutans]MDA0159156.1 bis-aminopropyl spermidine synthase family protein [Solirubrobacter ginsenosidimutans]
MISPHDTATDGSRRVAGHLRTLGPEARQARRLLTDLLDAGPTTLERLVAQTGAPRRDVEHLVKLMGEDADRQGHRIEVLAPEPYAALALAEPAPVPLPVEAMQELLAAAPAPVKSLDHVAATADTVLRRARWLDEQFELSQTRVLMLGDHDATTLAFGVLGIEIGALAVVDIDHDLLAYLGERSTASPYFADLRVGLPEPLRDQFDIVVTDPPYSAEGVGLFAARGVEAIDRHERGRLILAYGFPPSSPALGLKVQNALSGLDLVYEAVLPGFNHYDGAQAIGSRSAQYVLRPTRRSKRAAARTVARTVPTIYSHGRQSVESANDGPEVFRRLAEDAEAIDVDELFDAPRVRAGRVAVNLAPLHGRSLVHAALAAQAPEVDLVVPNETDGVRSESEQERTRRLLGAVRFRRSVDGTPFTIVHVAGTPPLPPPFAPLAETAGELAGRRPIDLPLHLLERLVRAEVQYAPEHVGASGRPDPDHRGRDLPRADRR